MTLIIDEATLETGVNKFVEVAIQYRLRITRLNPGSQILDARLVQYIGPDLMTPLNISFTILEFLLFLVPRLQFALEKPGFQHRHGRGPVAMLGTIRLALNHNPGRIMRNANGGISPIDMLTTGTAGPVGIHAQIRRVDFDCDVLVHLRIGKNRGK